MTVGHQQKVLNMTMITRGVVVLVRREFPAFKHLGVDVLGGLVADIWIISQTFKKWSVIDSTYTLRL